MLEQLKGWLVAKKSYKPWADIDSARAADRKGAACSGRPMNTPELFLALIEAHKYCRSSWKAGRWLQDTGLRCIQGDQLTWAQARQAYEHS
jgi:hypothetical protein